MMNMTYFYFRELSDNGIADTIRHQRKFRIDFRHRIGDDVHEVQLLFQAVPPSKDSQLFPRLLPVLPRTRPRLEPHLLSRLQDQDEGSEQHRAGPSAGLRFAEFHGKGRHRARRRVLRVVRRSREEGTGVALSRLFGLLVHGLSAAARSTASVHWSQGPRDQRAQRLRADRRQSGGEVRGAQAVPGRVLLHGGAVQPAALPRVHQAVHNPEPHPVSPERRIRYQAAAAGNSNSGCIVPAPDVDRLQRQHPKFGLKT